MQKFLSDINSHVYILNIFYVGFSYRNTFNNFFKTNDI